MPVINWHHNRIGWATSLWIFPVHADAPEALSQHPSLQLLFRQRVHNSHEALPTLNTIAFLCLLSSWSMFHIEQILNTEKTALPN